MTLIKSVSGIRGTIGGKQGENLTPIDIVKFTTSYVQIIKQRLDKDILKIVVGRDSRISGNMVTNLVIGTLSGIGAKAIDIGQATTPTVEVAVVEENADGGIIITASHNPRQWNALKLLNEKGEFLSAKDGEEILNIVNNSFDKIEYTDINKIQVPEKKDIFLDKHIELILNNQYVDKDAIMNANFKIAIDAVNSVGGFAIPKLLEALGVNEIVKLYCESTGEFPHNPEPLPENLTEISELIIKENCDLGFVVDPDVDRLAIVNEDGSMFGEEYTLVSVADYILSINKGNTVSNLSSTRALGDITEKYGAEYYASAVGEVNVVEEMKRVNAVIGGEGNGGIILPDLHYGRDALVGIALFLTLLAKSGKKCSELRAGYPEYYISKNKIQSTPDRDVDEILNKLNKKYSNDENVKVTTIDGVKLDFPEGWVHLRKSNTEPIIRIYAESFNKNKAEQFAEMIINEIE